MDDRSLENLKVAFSEWRSAKRCRSEAIPSHLWAWVCEIISDIGVQKIAQLAGILSLDSKKTREKYAAYVEDKSISINVNSSSQELNERTHVENALASKEDAELQECSESRTLALDSSASQAREISTKSHSITHIFGRRFRAKKSKHRQRIHVTRLVMGENTLDDGYQNDFDCASVLHESTKSPTSCDRSEAIAQKAKQDCNNSVVQEVIATISFMDVNMSINSVVPYAQLSELFVSISKQVFSKWRL